jgi:hypothetical protein
MRLGRLLCIVLTLFSLLGLVGCGGGDQPDQGNGTAGQLFLGQGEVLAQNLDIGGIGGTATVYRPGHALNGLSLMVPEGVYPTGTRVTIRSTPIARQTYSSVLRAITPLMTIENGGLPVEVGMMQLTIPITVSPGESALALSYDRQTQRVEVLSTLDATDTTLTVSLTRCAPPVDLTAPISSTSGIDIFVVGVMESALPATVDSGFRPGTDGWQFANQGSYATPGGQCLGWCTTALYYYATRRGTPPVGLFARYDNSDGPGWATPQLWQDDTRPYHLTVAAQNTEDGFWSTYLQGLPLPDGARRDRLQLLACRLALLLTGEPQLLSLYNPYGRMHVVLVYRITGETLAVADPEHPGDASRTITVGAAGFSSYEEYFELHYLSHSTAINWTVISDLWQLFDIGVVGNELFPRNQMEWKNDQGQWEAIAGSLTTTAAQIELRAMVDSVATPGWLAYNSQQQALDAAPVTTTRTYPLTVGANSLGCNIMAIPAGQTDWHWVNFQWVTITRQ